jgi:DNA modification methylase
VRPSMVQTNDYQLLLGDSLAVLNDPELIPDNSIPFACFSPPFINLFTYSNEIQDMGNSDDEEFALHFRFFIKGLHRVMMPGRIVCLHLSQVATKKAVEGHVALKDFRGDVIRWAKQAGFWYFGEWAIRKDPQMQAIKEKVRTLQFAQLESDSLGSRPGLSDFILILKKPGQAETRVKNDITRDEWINWAQGVWSDINESDTLNVRGTKGDDDKHVCPMNLTVIRRCTRMYSNKGEVVLSPFMGIGSEGVIAAELGRRFVGLELKPEYFDVATRNIDEAYRLARGQQTLFDLMEERAT